MELFLTPKYISGIVYVIGLAMAIGYLVLLPKKSSDTRLILSLLVAWFIGALVTISYEVTHPQLIRSGAALTDAVPLNFVAVMSLFVFMLIMGLFLYRVGFVFARKEEKVFLVVSALIIVYVSVTYILYFRDLSNLVVQARFMIQAPATWGVWLIAVGVRKLRVAYAEKREFRSKRLVMMALLTSIAALIFTVSNSYLAAVWPFSAEARGIIPALMTLLVAGLLIIGYLLYGEEKHSLLVKLVGFLLITYVAVFSVVVPLMRTEVSLRQDYLSPEAMSSLVFTPDSLGGYTVEKVPSRWIDPVGDAYVPADDDGVHVRSAFPMPFFGATYDSIWVGTNGSLSLGEFIDADRTYSDGLSFYDETPSVMVYYSDLLMAGSEASILVDAAPDRYLATWMKVSIYDLHESTLTMQTALYPDGRIELNYGELATIPLLSFIGISPGGPANPVLFTDEPLTGSSGQALFEYSDHRLSYRRSVHAIVVPVAWVGIIGLFFVLIGGVTFYRVGILNPLKRVLVGLGAVEKGDLEAEVVISEQNELGALADYFNRMTKSLRQYSSRMEEMVAQRTSELDKTIADLRATQDQLVEQEKLASLGALTAGIAHEIKNPLNFVNNFAEVSTELMEELSDAVAEGSSDKASGILNDLRENAEQIAKHGKRADSIVRAMMQHAKGGVSEMEVVDINVFLEEYANLAWHGMRARDHGFQAGVERAFDPNVETVTVMPQELGRVILNLFNNAFDALRDVENAVVTVGTRALKNTVEITISDNGPGIPVDIREKVFEPFFTTKPTGEGTGLGLSLSYDIVTKGHRGSMTAGESPDGGAMFVITLPA